MHRRHNLATPVFALLIFAFAFLVRAAFAWQWQSMPYGVSPQLDADVYDKWAWSLAQGSATDAQVFYQSPLYPYLLSLLYRIFGHNYLAASLFNAVMDSTSVVLLGLIARSLYGNKAALIAGILAALYAPMVFYTAPVMKEPLALLLLTLFLFTSLRALRGVSLRRYLICGLVLGLSILARGNILLLAPLVPIFAWLRYGKSSLPALALFVLGVSITFIPVIWHNARATHDFVPMTFDDGFNLYIGHSPYANGTNAYPPEVSTGPEQERIDVTWSAEQQAGHPLQPSEVSAFWRAKAIDFAIHNPQREVELLGRKFMAFWNNGDRFDNYDPVFIKRHFPSVLNWLPVSFGLIASLAAFAAVYYWPARNRLRHDDSLFLIICAGCYMISVLIFYVTDRYRLPVVIFLLPLAGAALPCILSALSKKDYRRLAASACGALFALIIAYIPPLDFVDLTAFDWAALSCIYSDAGQGDAALDAFTKAITASPQGAGSQTYIRAAGVYEKRGQMDDAEKWINTAVALFPQDGVVLYNKGRMQALRGNIDGALVTMQQAQRLDPTYELTYYALAMIYTKKGDAAHAAEAVKQGLAVNPFDTRLLALAVGGHAPETK